MTYDYLIAGKNYAYMVRVGNVSRWPIAIVLLLVAIAISGCNFNTSESTPTVEGFEQPINPLPEATTPSPTPSLTPSLTPTLPAVAQVITQIPTPTFTPTETLPPSETPGPWEYTVKSGETLGYIVQLPPFNYPPYDPSVIEAVIRLNNLASADDLTAGMTLLIPRPTSTPVPEGLQLTAVVAATQGIPMRDRVSLPTDVQIGTHQVREGESAVSIVSQYGGLTLEIFSQLNANISFVGCNFEEPSGGPNCNPLLIAGQFVNVPLPTPTITPSPTPSGSETPTTTPTFRAPNRIFPPDGSLVTGTITLYWDSVGILKSDEFYLIQVADLTTGGFFADITRNTMYELPDTLVPADNLLHEIQWSVSVASANSEGAFAPIGDTGTSSTFRWQSQ